MTTPIVAEPLRPLLVAMMLASPRPTPVTTPAGDTLATPVLLDDHVTAGSVTVFPDASLRVVDAWILNPMESPGCGSVTITSETFARTVTVALPLFPSLVAVMVALPTLTAVTMP
jgi:hypothetical protein